MYDENDGLVMAGIVNGVFGAVLLWIAIAAVAIYGTGCAGVRIGADITAIDKASESHSMDRTKVSWSCLFKNCNTEKEESGS